MDVRRAFCVFECLDVTPCFGKPEVRDEGRWFTSRDYVGNDRFRPIRRN